MCSYTQQNRVVERKNRHLIETTQTLLHGNVSSHFFGGYCPNHVLSYKLHAFTHLLLIYLGSHVLSTITLPILTNSGLDHSSVFFGYPQSQKRYRCYSPTLQRYLISANVTFFEFVPYFE